MKKKSREESLEQSREESLMDPLKKSLTKTQEKFLIKRNPGRSLERYPLELNEETLEKSLKESHKKYWRNEPLK